MKWTFCITYNNTDFLENQIFSIKNQKNIQNNYQIILIGPENDIVKNIISAGIKEQLDILGVFFQDTLEKGWITKKKNICVQLAKHENLVITHDYVSFLQNWYDNFLYFGEDWDVCMTPIRSFENKRWRDWIKIKYYDNKPPNCEFLSYSDKTKIKEMYVSGTYWCAKKSYMLKNPLNERYKWGDGEDIEWSLRCNKNWNYKLNENSIVKLLKSKEYFPPPETNPDNDTILAKKADDYNFTSS